MSSSVIPYGKQDISQQDIDAVVEVLKSNFLTQGTKLHEFEQTLTAYTGAKFALAVNSATSALHIACLALGLKKGDSLWTTPITFVASANCGLYCGAKVDFVDIDPITYNMCPVKLEQKLITAKACGQLPKIVVPVHLAGQACDMQAIKKLADKYHFHIIEDASHAIGGQYHNEFIGRGKYSAVTIFSFHPVKIVTTAEGGAALTNNPHLAEKMALLRNHGVTRDPNQMQGSPHGNWYYQQIDLGFNYRMTELQAALGITQMQRLTEFVTRRHQLANRYMQLLKDLPILLPSVQANTQSSWHLFVIRLQPQKIKLSHKEVFNRLQQKGIGVNLHYIPVHTQPYYQQLGFSLGDFPESEKYYQEAISLPLFHSMTNKEQNTVVAALQRVLKEE